jgi:hypothetical protein
VRPPRRLGAREQSLPWARLSLPLPRSRVNHPPWRPPVAAGTPVAGDACSRAVNAGSCPHGPRHATAAPSANAPLAAGGAGMPRNATEPPLTGSNTAGTRPAVIAAAGFSAPQAPSRRLHLPRSSTGPRGSRRSHQPRPTRPLRPSRPARASAQPKSRKNPRACPATGRAATSRSFPRRVPLSSTSVRAAVARRYDGSDSGKPDSGAGGSAADGRNAAVIAGRLPLPRSCRHVLRMPHPEDYVSCAPEDRGGSGWAGRSGPPFPLSASGALW